MNNIEKKRAREQKIVEQMITLYCKKNHNSKDNLCEECAKLCEYAKYRSQKCPFMEKKTFCSNCKIHCYEPKMREKIKEVMRFSGPRIIFYHPIMASWHLITSIKEKRQIKEQASDKDKTN